MILASEYIIQDIMIQDILFDKNQLPPEYQLRVTEDYEKLVPFFIENELEFSEEEPVSTDIIKGDRKSVV